MPRGQCQRIDSVCHAIPTRHWTRPTLGIAIGRFLNNARRAEAAASTRLHQFIIESWIGPPLEPDERHGPQIPQSNPFELGQGMPLGNRQQQSFLCELPMGQVRVPRCDRCGKPSVQAVG